MTATVDREEASRELDAAPSWVEVPPPVEPRETPPAMRALLRAAVGALIAAGLWWLGHAVAAIVLVFAIVLVTVASWLFPAVATALDRGSRWMGRTVGRALNFIVLGGLVLIVFTPMAAVMRLIRHDPLARGSSRNDESFWHQSPTARRRPLWRRQFTYERSRAGTGPGLVRRRVPFLRVRGALGLLVVVLLLDVAIGSTVRGGRDRVDASEATTTWPDIAAWENEPWAGQLFAELAQINAQRRPHPFRAWTFGDFSGQLVHMGGGVRVSYQSAGSDSEDAIDVFFFGGSTMFGGFQRDQFTIPSQFARLAEAEGIPVRVVNHGALGYTLWQEVQLLEELLTSGERPDVVVFYDGANELNVQSWVGPTTEPSHIYARTGELPGDVVEPAAADDSSVLSEAYEWYSERSAFVGLFRQARSLVTERELEPEPARSPTVWAPDQSPERGVERANNAVAIHRRGVELAQHLAESFGFEALYFWQPLLYTKEIVAGEESVVGLWGETPPAWRAATAEARRDLQAPVIDLSDALDGVEEPVMVDYHHTNELGADVIARAIYEHARSRLQLLAPSARP